MTAKKLVSQNIKALRDSFKMNQPEFAEFLEVPMTTFKDWEYGKTIPKADALENISKKCGIEISEIFLDRSSKKNNLNDNNYSNLAKLLPLLPQIENFDDFLEDVQSYIKSQGQEDDLFNEDGEEFFQTESKKA